LCALLPSFDYYFSWTHFLILFLLPSTLIRSSCQGLPASTGLWTSWAMAGVAALTGGRGGTVTGVSRSCAVVIAALVGIVRWGNQISTCDNFIALWGGGCSTSRGRMLLSKLHVYSFPLFLYCILFYSILGEGERRRVRAVCRAIGGCASTGGGQSTSGEIHPHRASSGMFARYIYTQCATLLWTDANQNKRCYKQDLRTRCLLQSFSTSVMDVTIYSCHIYIFYFMCYIRCCLGS